MSNNYQIDRKDARAEKVLDQIYDLRIDMVATDERLAFPFLYAVGRDGVAMTSPEKKGKNLDPLFDTILAEVPGPAF